MQKENSFYEIWFEDGSQATPNKLFKVSEATDYAVRYDFDVKHLLEHGEVDFLDEDGHVIGGVQTINFDKKGAE